MICEADPNGHGYISYSAFENIIATFKQYKEERVVTPIGINLFKKRSNL